MCEKGQILKLTLKENLNKWSIEIKYLYSFWEREKKNVFIIWIYFKLNKRKKDYSYFHVL